MKIPILSTVVTRLGYKLKGIRIWMPCNVYPSAKIGRHVSIGMFSEIGPRVEIGDDTHIGMGVFIPEGVKIGKRCFIGPKTCFTNDLFPPSHKSQWEQTYICDDVSIGAGVIILAGISIGSYSLIGAGSVITKNVESHSRMIGVPGRNIASSKTKDKD